MKKLFLIILLYISCSCFAQTASNIQAYQDGNKVVVTYDLDKPSTNVALRVSIDGGKNFSGNLKAVSGNVGGNIPAGSNRIVWDVLVEREKLVGENICFQVIAKSQYLFSVGPSKYVVFSPGNLQYNASLGSHKCADGSMKPGTWRFAEHQYDIIGAANSNISATYDGWIDLFGWGTSGYHNAEDTYNKNYYPYSTASSVVNTTYNRYGYGPSTNMADPSLVGTSANYDWGVYNAISNGGNAVGLWRTLAKDEWVYLFQTRANATSLYFRATVNGIAGMVILPDNWKEATWDSYISVAYTLGVTNYTTNVYSATQWKVFDTWGAVFLPAAGLRYGTGVDYVGTYGLYWSSTYRSANYAYNLYFSLSSLLPSGSYGRYDGSSVRLVQDL